MDGRDARSAEDPLVKLSQRLSKRRSSHGEAKLINVLETTAAIKQWLDHGQSPYGFRGKVTTFRFRFDSAEPFQEQGALRWGRTNPFVTKGRFAPDQYSDVGGEYSRHTGRSQTEQGSPPRENNSMDKCTLSSIQCKDYRHHPYILRLATTC